MHNHTPTLLERAHPPRLGIHTGRPPDGPGHSFCVRATFFRLSELSKLKLPSSQKPPAVALLHPSGGSLQIPDRYDSIAGCEGQSPAHKMEVSNPLFHERSWCSIGAKMYEGFDSNFSHRVCSRILWQASIGVVAWTRIHHLVCSIRVDD